jgi:hypothetical protein
MNMIGLEEAFALLLPVLLPASQKNYAVSRYSRLGLDNKTSCEQQSTFAVFPAHLDGLLMKS